MPVETAWDLAVFFNAAEFAIAANYFAPGGGGPTPCIILHGGRVDFPEFEAVPRTAGTSILVRASEVAAPARGGRFVTLTSTYTIVGEPVVEETDRSVWLCMAG